MFCSQCGLEQPVDAAFCQRCGRADLDVARQRHRRRLLWGLAAALALVAGLSAAYFIGSASNGSGSESASDSAVSRERESTTSSPPTVPSTAPTTTAPPTTATAPPTSAVPPRQVAAPDCEGVSACNFENGIDVAALRVELANDLTLSGYPTPPDGVDCEQGSTPSNRVAIGASFQCLVPPEVNGALTLFIVTVTGPGTYMWEYADI